LTGISETSYRQCEVRHRYQQWF